MTHPRADDPPTDYTSNTVYFNTDAVPTDANFQALSDAFSTLWKRAGGLDTTWGFYDNRNHQVRVYSMDDAEPRPIRGMTTYTSGFPTTGPLYPREVALCLSYYHDRNLPRQRGRIYIGPFDVSQFSMADRPPTNLKTQVLDLGKRLFQLGTGLTPVWVHAVHSTRIPTVDQPVSHYWLDDSWDTQRRRGIKASSRVRYDP